MTSGKNYKWNFQDMLKTISLSLLLRSQLTFSERFEIIMKRNKKNKKQSVLCVLETDLRKEKVRGT